MCEHKCLRSFECEGNCMLNLAGDAITFDVFSPLCKGTKKEQEFWDKHVDEHPIDEIKEFYKLKDMDALVPGDFIRNIKNKNIYMIIEDGFKYGIVNIKDGHVIGWKDSINDIFENKKAFELIKTKEIA